MEVAEEFGKYLGTALANVACVADPEVFVIGGGVSKAGQIVIDYIKKYYMANAFMTCKQARFALAELGNDAESMEQPRWCCKKTGYIDTGKACVFHKQKRSHKSSGIEPLDL